jgi:hypothetical protein
MTDVTTGKYPLKASATHDHELRRDLVGGLIRYLKDGDTDFGHLIFNYVHVGDYGQAMLEGWGELHALLLTPHHRIGPFGLPLSRFSITEQFFMLWAFDNLISDDGDSKDGGPDGGAIRDMVIDQMDRAKIWRGILINVD